MIRFWLILTLTLVTLGTWIFQSRPELVLNMAMSEWGVLEKWFQSSPESDLPEAPLATLPFIAENRGASTLFQPRLRDFAPRLSVPTAHAAIIIDAETGRELYAQSADTRRQVASLTKLFTALIIVERIANLDEVVTIDEEAVYTEGTRVGCPRSGFCNGVRLKVGETITVRSLLQAMLMNSANDTAMALAKHLSGSRDAFVAEMNARATTLGLTNSHFCTPSGLEIDGRETECYSTARDIALVAAEALKYQVIWDMMQSEKTTITSVDGTLTHEIFNTDQLLGSMPNLVGTKTGFTPLAGYSLLAVAENPEGAHPVIAVVLNDPYRWESIRSMFSWSFQAYDWI